MLTPELLKSIFVKNGVSTNTDNNEFSLVGGCNFAIENGLLHVMFNKMEVHLINMI